MSFDKSKESMLTTTVPTQVPQQLCPFIEYFMCPQHKPCKKWDVKTFSFCGSSFHSLKSTVGEANIFNFNKVQFVSCFLV
jgi:hypothetical protein